MKDVLKGKVVTGLVIVATIILAGVAVYTASRLYGLRDQGVSPNAPGSEPLAWDCSKYTFDVSASGVVTLKNLSSRDESSQQAKLYVNNTLVATFDVPATLAGQTLTLGTVSVPSTGFSWKVEGTKDCRNSGTIASACKLLTFTLTANSPTASPSPTVTSALTPTDVPVGGASFTPTTTNTPSPTNTPTPTIAPTATTGPSVTPTLPPPPEMPSPPNCDSQKPTAPTLSSVTRNGTSATLTWTSVPLATHYVISYGTSPTNLQFGVPNTGNVTSYTINSLSASTKYYFTVYAVNNCMPSDGSPIVPTVSGASTAVAQNSPTPGAGLPSAGSGLVTVITFGIGIALITFALLSAI